MFLHLIFFSMILISLTKAQPICNRSCTSNTNPVPYPFGFSDGCEIRLSCSDTGEILLSEYTVQNLSRDSMLIGLPPKCDRKYDDIRLFNNSNFALTSRNGLLLANCSSSLNDCMLPTRKVENQLKIQQCDSLRNRSLNCYSEDNLDRNEFIDLKRLEDARCQVLFSSVIVESNGSSLQNMPVSVDFQLLELGWWVQGECKCHVDAVCRYVSVENRRVGFRCNCNEGFVGDGFVAGDGCRRG